MSKVIMPQCIAEYEAGHDTCDGEIDGETEVDRAPCRWRDNCVGLMIHCTSLGKTIEETGLVDFQCSGSGNNEQHWAVPVGRPDEFLAMCQKLIEKYGIKNGKVVTLPKFHPEGDKRKLMVPPEKVHIAAGKALKALARHHRALMYELFDYFRAQIAEQLPTFEFALRRQAVAVGKFYVVDRVKNTGYVTIYCKTNKGRDRPLVRAVFKARSITLNVKLAVDVGDYDGVVSKAMLGHLNPQHCSDGFFKSVMPHLDKEGSAVAAEAIGRLVAHGKIELPVV